MSIARGLKQLGFEPEVDFICQDDRDGKGAYISKWLSSSAQPSDSVITSAANTADINDTNTKYRRDREFAYADIKVQLDQLWHDIDDGKLDNTGSWYKSVKDVKEANPK